MHVEGMSVHSRRRLHAPNIKPDAGWDLFFQVSPREFRLWDPEKDPAPRYKDDFDDNGGERAEKDAGDEDPFRIARVSRSSGTFRTTSSKTLAFLSPD